VRCTAVHSQGLAPPSVTVSRASVLTEIEGAATDGRSTDATEVAVPGLG
jgi:hypothetical protein